jgi:hypothetical protein
MNVRSFVLMAGLAASSLSSLLFAQASQQQLPPVSDAERWRFFVEETVSPFTVIASAATAVVSQALKSDPQYGSGRAALAQRFGAATADNITQNFFSDFVMASALRQDTRYRRMGPPNGFWRRFGYAISRAVITRKDAGGSTLNWSNFTGAALSAGLSNAYYPPPSRTGVATVINWANSIGGTGFGNLFPEFLPDFKKWFRRHHP